METVPDASGLFSLRGKRALVTGASSGLGHRAALVFAKAGASVVAAARRKDRLADLVRQITEAGGQALAVECDVRSPASVTALFDEIEQTGPVADVVLNCAGIATSAPFLAQGEAEWDSVVGTNLTAAWRVARESAARLVKAAKPGTIINMVSVTGIRAQGHVAPYAAAKAGLDQLSRVMALELARYNIRTNSLAPGYFSTELNSDHLKSKGGEQMRMKVPMRRFGKEGELDGAMLLLASDAGSYINGSTIVVDGGHLQSSL
ncbi:short-chain dehydrogenase/reductase SDR [Hyaloraphidium curvatum]|nr:short-chain dehydrogenase/reductase SDR [Hyaloraphidium curvatum]